MRSFERELTLMSVTRAARNKRARTSVVAWGAALLLMSANLAGAATIVSLTGSGDLSLTTSGALYFDASDLAATDLHLSATTGISIGTPFPSGVPAAGSDPLALANIAGTTNLSLDGDVYFDLFDFSGSVSFLAESIHVIGMIEASGDIVLTSGNIQVTDTDLISGNGGTSLCAPAGNVTISSWTSTTGGGCSDLGPIDGGNIGGPIGPGGPILIGTAPVPEPRAALLFFLGTTILAVRRLY